MEQSKPLFQKLQELLQEEGSVSLGELMEHAGDQTYGLLITLLAILSSLPGVNTPAALAILLLGGQMALGRPYPWLPERIQRIQLQQGRTKQRLARLESLIRRLGPRPLAHHPLPQRGLGLIVLGVAFLGALPLPIIPFANVLPAISLALIGVALVEERPGLAWLGTACGVFAAAYLVVYSHAAVLALRKVLQYLPGFR